MTGVNKSFDPVPENHEMYKKLYALYKQLHDGFGSENSTGGFYNIMKDLLDIRDNVKKGR